MLNEPIKILSDILSLTPASSFEQVLNDILIPNFGTAPDVSAQLRSYCVKLAKIDLHPTGVIIRTLPLVEGDHLVTLILSSIHSHNVIPPSILPQIWSIFEHLPSPSPQTDSPELTLLHVEIDKLEKLLVAIDVIYGYGYGEERGGGGC